jgi:hypothetical protein
MPGKTVRLIKQVGITSELLVIREQSIEAVSNRLQTSLLLAQIRREWDWAITTANTMRARREKESACCLTGVASRHRVPQNLCISSASLDAYEIFRPGESHTEVNLGQRNGRSSHVYRGENTP